MDWAGEDWAGCLNSQGGPGWSGLGKTGLDCLNSQGGLGWSGLGWVTEDWA